MNILSYLSYIDNQGNIQDKKLTKRKDFINFSVVLNKCDKLETIRKVHFFVEFSLKKIY